MADVVLIGIQGLIALTSLICWYGIGRQLQEYRIILGKIEVLVDLEARLYEERIKWFGGLERGTKDDN